MPTLDGANSTMWRSERTTTVCVSVSQEQCQDPLKHSTSSTYKTRGLVHFSGTCAVGAVWLWTVCGDTNTSVESLSRPSKTGVVMKFTSWIQTGGCGKYELNFSAAFDRVDLRVLVKGSVWVSLDESCSGSVERNFSVCSLFKTPLSPPQLKHYFVTDSALLFTVSF